MAHAVNLRSERFQIVRELGRGGMGVVYAARDGSTGAVVALKTLTELDGEALYRLKNEFRLVANLHHPNLVRLGELHCERDQWFFTMELVDGVPFSEHVRPGGRVDEARVRAAFHQLAQGLAALHAAGQVHRDVKPSNVLVDRKGRVVLLDFGLASDLRRNRHGSGDDDSLMGTPEYMAPEQALSEAVTPAADTYALGTMLFEALTGRLPFRAEGLGIVEAKVTAERAPSPRSLVRTTPSDLDELCQELLQPDPELRPTADAVARRLAASGAFRRAPEVRYVGDEGPTPFVGRAPELGALRAALETSRAGERVHVLVTGEPGVGKTAVVERFLDEAQEEDPSLLVLRGRCYEQETVPFQGFDAVIDSLSRALKERDEASVRRLLPPETALLAALFPVLRRVPVIGEGAAVSTAAALGPAGRAEAVSCLRELFVRLAADAPVVLFLDDLQWMDADGFELLGELRKLPSTVSMLVVATMRSRTATGSSVAPPADAAAGPRRSVRDQLEALASDGYRKVTVGALSDAESRALLHEGNVLTEVQRESILREAKGHPLFLAELARATMGGAPTELARLEDTIVGRVRSLEGAAQRLLAATAVAGLPTRLAVLCRAVGLDLAAGDSALATLRVAHLVRVRREGSERLLEAYHDRVREAVLAELEIRPESLDGLSGRDPIHLGLGRALLDGGADQVPNEALFPGVRHIVRAAHLLAPNERRDLAELAVKAARRARLAMAFGAAAWFAREGIGLLGADAWRTHRAVMVALHREGLESEALAGHPDAARALFEALLPHVTDVGERAALYAQLVAVSGALRRFELALTLGRTGLLELGVRLPARGSQAAVLLELLRLRWALRGRSDSAFAELPASLDARARGIVELLMALTPAAYFLDLPLLSVIVLRIARFAVQHGATDASAYGIVGYAMLLGGAFGEHTRARAVGDAAVTLVERGGQPLVKPKVLHIHGMMVSPWSRPFAECRAVVERALAAGLETGEISFRTYSASALSGLLELEARSLDETLASCERGLAIDRAQGDLDMTLALLARKRLILCLKDPSVPVSRLLDTRALEAEAGGPLTKATSPMAVPYFHAFCMMMLYLRGDVQGALEHRDRVVEHMDALFAIPLLIDFRFYEALIEAALLPNAGFFAGLRARAKIRSTLRWLEAQSRVCPENFRARYLIVAAEERASRGQRSEARAHLREAADASRATNAFGLAGLAWERAMRHAEADGDLEDARRCREAAVAAYTTFGALAKVAELAGAS